MSFGPYLWTTSRWFERDPMWTVRGLCCEKRSTWKSRPYWGETDVDYHAPQAKGNGVRQITTTEVRRGNQNQKQILSTDHSVELRHGKTHRIMCRRMVQFCLHKCVSALKLAETQCMDDHQFHLKNSVCLYSGIS